jgi:excisionase family DNA binding protein
MRKTAKRRSSTPAREAAASHPRKRPATTVAASSEQLRVSAERVHNALGRMPSTRRAVPLRELNLELEDTLIPLKALQVAEELLREQANGQDPDVLVLGEEMTAQDAANMLGVSRTHLNALLERERIPHTKTTGGHRRIPASAVFDYKYRRDAAHAAMREAMQAGEQLADED